ncbi:MAG: hypothetical protein ACREA9_00965 [Pyrinomonadaceae bacterium]
MKTEQFKSVILANKQRVGVALLSFVCLTLVVFTPGAAQLRGQKHVTAIQLGGAAEGSRVTVVSDSPLSDYEAFRRGDRFHVKIPLADLSSAAPHFRADGFEDVQVQKVGDSLIVSFKLQPGATARVDQRGNRLDVVFSAPYRSSFNNTTTSGSRRFESSQTSPDRGRDAAGPMPSDSAPASRLRIVTDRAGSVNVSRVPGDPRWQTGPKTYANRNSDKAANKKSTTGSVATASPPPLSSPSSILSPGNSRSYSPVTTTTSPAAASPTAAAGSSASSSVSNFRNGQAAVRQWMSAKRLATLLGALILLSLVVYLAAAIRSPQKTVVKATRAKAPKVRPRYSADGELNELSRAGIHEQSSLRDSAQPPSSRPSAIVAPAQDQAWTSPTIVSPIAGYDELSSEAEEREVFEL